VTNDLHSQTDSQNQAADLAVAGVAAYVSYQHAFEVVRAHGESGLTARLEPATIDGLVYSSSMVILYAARHRLRVPGLAQWLLALGIVATLAANVAHGWSNGPVGAVVAAWPAASLVGSYELLLWLIRTAAAGAVVHAQSPGQVGGPADHPVAGLRLVPMPTADSPAYGERPEEHLSTGGLDDRGAGHLPGSVRTSGPVAWHGYQASHPAGQMSADRSSPGTLAGSEDDINAAAVAAYRTSARTGRPLSERKLAAMFGKTSRRWARNRMAEARQDPVSALADNG
jgi:hypothetical protein